MLIFKKIIGLILLVILKLFKPIVIIRFGFFQSSRIGGFIPQVENYIQSKKNKNKKQLDIITFENDICNTLIKNLARSKIKIYKKNKIILRIIECINIASGGKNIHIIQMIGFPIDSHLLNCKTFLEDNNKINKEKLICIHNRDNKYLNENLKKNNWDYHNFRNFSITDMKSTAEYYLAKNYKVVRIGNTAEEKLKITNPNFIDYPFLNNKSEELEFEYMNKCEYYIGCNSGLWMLALHLKKKMLITNWHEFSLLNNIRHNRFSIIPRLYFDQNLSRYLTIDEVCQRKLDRIGHDNLLHKENIKLLSNNSQDILNSSKEFIKMTNSKYIESEIEKEFWSIIKKYNKNTNKKINVNISNYFLNKYQKVLFK